MNRLQRTSFHPRKSYTSFAVNLFLCLVEGTGNREFVHYVFKIEASIYYSGKTYISCLIEGLWEFVLILDRTNSEPRLCTPWMKKLRVLMVLSSIYFERTHASISMMSKMNRHMTEPKKICTRWNICTTDLVGTWSIEIIQTEMRIAQDRWCWTTNVNSSRSMMLNYKCAQRPNPTTLTNFIVINDQSNPWKTLHYTDRKDLTIVPSGMTKPQLSIPLFQCNFTQGGL